MQFLDDGFHFSRPLTVVVQVLFYYFSERSLLRVVFGDLCFNRIYFQVGFVNVFELLLGHSGYFLQLFISRFSVELTPE